MNAMQKQFTAIFLGLFFQKVEIRYCFYTVRVRFTKAQWLWDNTDNAYLFEFFFDSFQVSGSLCSILPSLVVDVMTIS